MTLNQDEFLKAKKRLDKLIDQVGALADLAFERSVDCCRSDELDLRDDLGEMASILRRAQAELLSARAKGGRLDGGGLTRGGST